MRSVGQLFRAMVMRARHWYRTGPEDAVTVRSLDFRHLSPDDLTYALSVSSREVKDLLGWKPPVRKANERASDNLLEDLADKYIPSKRFHNYMVPYWTHFRDVRHQVRKVVEIGVQTQAPLLMWEEFFPNATIFGLDVDPACERYTEKRRVVFIGDQKDPVFLKQFIRQTGGGFDIIIDDAEHTNHSIMRSFVSLFPAMSDRGIYVIEDLVHYVKPTVATLSSLTDQINYWPDGFPAPDWEMLDHFPELTTPWIARNLVGIAFYRFICFLFRGFNPEQDRFLLPQTEAGRQATLQRVRDRKDAAAKYLAERGKRLE